jgi:hypothetical protein
MSAGLTDDVTFRVAVDAYALCIGVLATQVFLDSYATEVSAPRLRAGSSSISRPPPYLRSCPTSTLGLSLSRGYKDLGATTYAFENEQYENRVLAKALHGQTAT